MYEGNCFVVNVHSALCFDIDIGRKLHTKIKTETKEYTYKDVEYDTMAVSEERVGHSYSCRIFGIRAIKKSCNRAKSEISRQVNFSDGKAKVKVKYVDNYGRLIIELSIDGTDVSEFLLKNYPEIFVKY